MEAAHRPTLTDTSARSSWITAIAFRRGYLVIFTTSGTALLYAHVPSWLPGLLVAGTARRSVGHAYHKLVKGRFLFNRIEAERVQELRALLAS